MSSAYKEYEEMSGPERRDYWWKWAEKNHTYTRKKFEEEVKKYLKAYRNEFASIFPDEVLKSDRIDVNVIYPIVKTLIPQLYFKDPQVIIKAEVEKLRIPQFEIGVSEDPATGEMAEQQVPSIDPTTGIQVVHEYDGPESAFLMQSQINSDIRKAKLKQHVKMAIYDAHLGFFGALKTGFGSDQGVKNMEGDAPPSGYDELDGDAPYAIRLKPWDVVPDCANFYKQNRTGISWVVHPAELWKDARLKNATPETIKGEVETDTKSTNGYFIDREACLTHYYEIYQRPCAEFPNGKYILLSEEIKDDLLFESDWPYEKTRSNPIKFLYFNPDPEGGLPIPSVRYYFSQQKVKNQFHKIAFEYVSRALPFVGVDFTRAKNDKELRAALKSGTTPKFVDTSGVNPNSIIAAFSHNNLNSDFWRLDGMFDNDIARMTGLINGVYPAGQTGAQYSSEIKIADAGSQVRQGEAADVVFDFLTEILTQWVKYRQEFVAPENYTILEGEDYPTSWPGERMNLPLRLEVKPFSMNYEDPVIMRDQRTKLLNLLAGPAIQMALEKQGATPDFVHLVKWVLATFQEKEVQSFLLTGDMKPENQVQTAIQESFMILDGGPHQIKPTDNHKVHILIHSLFMQFAQDPARGLFAEAVAAHEQALLQMVPGSPGGGNQENPNAPVGNAMNQELMKKSPEPNSTNKKTAIEREAKKHTR